MNIKRVLLQIEASRAYGRSLLAGIAEYSKRYGPWAFYHEDPFYSNKIINGTQQVLIWKPNGIITRFPQYLEKIKELGVPTVIAIHIENNIPGIPNVKGDNAEIGQLAADYLVRRGFHNFGFCGLKRMFWSNDRRRAFEATICKAGYKTHIFLMDQNQSSQHNNLQLMADWLISIPKPIAVMACNDDIAKEFLESAKIVGIRIPDDVAVIGVDNDEVVCSLCHPTLSSIKLNNFRAGYEAARLLDAMMQGKNPPADEVIVRPVAVVTRQSTNVFCVEDEAVKKALWYIRENSRKQIQVEDVANYVCLSKRMLQIRFKNVLGYSIHERIKKEKINRMAELLTETNMSIVEIGQSLGFSEINHISRFFKSVKGHTPVDYRRQYGMK
jgi:LacI family transcriptional regulator